MSFRQRGDYKGLPCIVNRTQANTKAGSRKISTMAICNAADLRSRILFGPPWPVDNSRIAMEPLTLELLTNSITDEGWASLAGSVSCALYCTGDAPDGPLTREVLTEVIRRLPEYFWHDAFRLGFSHFQVSHDVVNFLQGRFEELGSFDAFVSTPVVAP